MIDDVAIDFEVSLRSQQRAAAGPHSRRRIAPQSLPSRTLARRRMPTRFKRLTGL